MIKNIIVHSPSFETPESGPGIKGFVDDFLRKARAGDFEGAMRILPEIDPQDFQLFGALVAQRLSSAEDPPARERVLNQEQKSVPLNSPQEAKEYRKRFQEFFQAGLRGEARAKAMGKQLSDQNSRLFTECVAEFVLQHLVGSDHPAAREARRAANYESEEAASRRAEKNVSRVRERVQAAVLVLMGVTAGIGGFAALERSKQDQREIPHSTRELSSFVRNLLSVSRPEQVISYEDTTEEELRARGMYIKRNEGVIGKSGFALSENGYFLHAPKVRVLRRGESIIVSYDHSYDHLDRKVEITHRADGSITDCAEYVYKESSPERSGLRLRDSTDVHNKKVQRAEQLKSKVIFCDHLTFQDLERRKIAFYGPWMKFDVLNCDEYCEDPLYTDGPTRITVRKDGTDIRIEAEVALYDAPLFTVLFVAPDGKLKKKVERREYASGTILRKERQRPGLDLHEAETEPKNKGGKRSGYRSIAPSSGPIVN